MLDVLFFSLLFVGVALCEFKLCSLLQDDVMMPQRVRLQLEAAAQHPTSVSPASVPSAYMSPASSPSV